jgi:hypothetical protein
MDKYTATEQAYKHGYEKGYADGERNAVVLCKSCQFGKIYETNGKYHCRSQMGLNRMVHPNEFCSWGEKKLDAQTADALVKMGQAAHGGNV